jgi:hypothetical protein
MKNAKPPGIWEGQLLHFTALSILLVMTAIFWTDLGRPFPTVFWTAIAIPVLHQLYVWVCWRFELQSSAVSGTIGFRSYLVIFFIFLAARVVAVFILAWLDEGSLNIGKLPRVAITMILLVIWGYAAYSIKSDFGFVRAAGADHFDPAYRDMPLVREGIFRFTNNGMYIFGFLIFWAMSIGFASTAALVATVFSHAYIWVNFYATEKPDMNYLYSRHEL